MLILINGCCEMNINKTFILLEFYIDFFLHKGCIGKLEQWKTKLCVVIGYPGG